MDNERHLVIQTINNFNTAYMKKDWDGVKKCLASTVHCFGTDTSEIINSVSDFEKITKNNWTKYEAIKLSSPMNLFIEMDKDAELADAVYYVMFNHVAGGKSTMNILHISAAFKKENGEWRIVHMVTGLSTMGETGKTEPIKIDDGTVK